MSKSSFSDFNVNTDYYLLRTFLMFLLSNNMTLLRKDVLHLFIHAAISLSMFLVKLTPSFRCNLICLNHRFFSVVKCCSIRFSAAQIKLYFVTTRFLLYIVFFWSVCISNKAIATLNVILIFFFLGCCVSYVLYF